MRPRSVRRILGILLLLNSLLAASFRPVFAAVESNAGQPVRVAVVPYEQYAEQDENGVWTGYDIEMVENIAQNAGFSVEFVTYQSISEAVEGLSAGTIDMVCDMAKTPEREASYLFSDYEQGSSGVCIAVKKDNDTISYGSIDQLAGLTYASSADSVGMQKYQNWCSEHGFLPQISIYPTVSEMFTAFENGETDAVILTDDSAVGGKYRSVLSFDQTSYYFMFAGSNHALKNKVDTAAAKIFTQNPLYEQNLKQKYGISSAASLTLTKEEKDYIALHPAVTVAVVENDEPYYHTGTDGTASGILPDLYGKIADDTGLSFTFRAYDSQSDATSAVLTGEADILGIFSDGIPYASSAGLRLTSSYSTVSLVMISRTGTDAEMIRRIAIKKRSMNAVKKGIGSTVENAELIACGSATECFLAVKNGQADALIVALPSASWIINQTNSSAYSFVPLSGTGIDLNAAVRYDDSMLADIMSKGIQQNADLFNGIVANHTGSENPLQAAVSRIPAAAIVGFAAGMVAIVIFLIWAVFSVNRSRKSKVAAVQAKAAAEEQRIKAEASEKSAEEKNAFFSNISHDMRTPLNGILGFADLAQQQSSLDQAKMYIGKIKVSGNLLLSLINDTLTISKISNGKLELKPGPVDTEEMIQGIVSSIQLLASQKNVDFQVDETGLHRRTVLADQLNLEKIFLNLLSNAVKFTPAGGHVRFVISDQPAAAADPDILFTVQDDGIGMTEAYLQHMYEPFSQEKRHGYDSIGTGLGLSIVKQLVTLMGGSIDVASKVGAGTVFQVRLHLPTVTAAKVPAVSGAAEQNLASLEGKQILLCEDNALNREIATELLKQAGMTVVTAENGQLGVDLFSRSEANEFAAILMDLRMPVMDGLSAARTIRRLARPDAKTIPIIAMTADAFSEDIQKCRDAGMNAHVAKPMNAGELLHALQKGIAESQILPENKVRTAEGQSE